MHLVLTLSGPAVLLYPNNEKGENTKNETLTGDGTDPAHTNRISPVRSLMAGKEPVQGLNS